MLIICLIYHLIVCQNGVPVSHFWQLNHDWRNDMTLCDNYFQFSVPTSIISSLMDRNGRGYKSSEPEEYA